MNKFLTVFTTLIFAVCAAAATKPFVYDTQTGNAPALNKLYRDFYIFVDMAPLPQSASSGSDIIWWTDFEVKVIDKYRNTLYFSSTIYLNSKSVINGHKDIIDTGPSIYYLSDQDSYDYYRCFGAKTKFSNFSSSIGATVGNSYKVSGVWFYPNLDSQTTINAPVYTGFNSYSKKRSMKFGDYIREIFTNPENTIIVWRQTIKTVEQLPSGRKRWIVVQPTYYGDFKVKTN